MTASRYLYSPENWVSEPYKFCMTLFFHIPLYFFEIVFMLSDLTILPVSYAERSQSLTSFIMSSFTGLVFRRENWRRNW